MGLEPKFFKNGNNYYLLLAVIIQMTFYTFFEDPKTRLIALNMFSTFVLIAAVYAVGIKKHQIFIAISIAILAFLGIWHSIIIESKVYLLVFSVIFQIVFYIYVIRLLLKSLFRAKQVDANIIYGAIVVYLLIGISFSLLYSLIEGTTPSSFCINNIEGISQKLNVFDFVYYSFTTLTSTGYGDISAVSLQARATSNIEAVIGVMYVAIIISRFVSIYIFQSLNKRPD